ncbi:MAG TPA: SurA N-terminal domain-containing protein [Acidobacteriaceae bacterium]|nr:SurA N-terminal domain-containing protein [Acidobacteriaceae bacterium]
MRSRTIRTFRPSNSPVNHFSSGRTASALLPLALLALAGCRRPPAADVVATVNGHAIMRSQLDSMYQGQLAQAQGRALSPEEADQLRLSSVRELINEEIFVERAAKMNLTATPEEVDAKINEIKARVPTEEIFEQQLKASNRTLDELKRDVRQQLTIEKLVNKEIKSKVTVTDADVTSYFDQHKAEFDNIEPTYHLARIQVTSVPSPEPANLQGSKATTDAEAKRKIQALKTRLDSGEDFGTIAANFSEDPNTASSGGDMGFLRESQLRSDPTVGTALLKLNPGQISDIFPLQDAQSKKPAGYSIYKLLEREPAGQREISDPGVQQQIRQLLRDSRSQLIQNAYFEMLHDQAKVENFFAEEIFKNETK